MLKNTAQSNSEDMGNIALQHHLWCYHIQLLGIDPLDKDTKKKKKNDYVAHALSVIEGVQSKGHSTKAFNVDSVSGCVSALFDKF